MYELNYELKWHKLIGFCK